MDIWIAALAIWLALLWTVVVVRMGWSDAAWARDVAYKPTEALADHQLFGLLLGANLALLEHDDFNQLASRLPRRNIREILARHWNVQSAHDFHRVLDARLHGLGAASLEEAQAFAAWQARRFADTQAYQALCDVLVFLSVHSRVAKPGEIRDQPGRMLAWDVQQVAYLLRLGFTLGYVSRERVWFTLDGLQHAARARYTSWKDYSLSALVGMGVRGAFDLDDIGEWYQIARSHSVFMSARRLLLAHASDWSARGDPTVDLRSAGFAAAGMPTTAFDSLL